MRALLACLLIVLSTSNADAQGMVFAHAVDQANSNFSWSGTSSLGAIVGNPSNQFRMAGGLELLQSAALPQPVGSAAFHGGDAQAVPDLHGKINNVLIFLPPLAPIDVLGLHVALNSPSFSVDAAGTFQASVILSALSGTLVVTPLGSSPTSTDLTGSSSAPTSMSGSLVAANGVFTLTAPVDASFPFSDPTTGASGSITLSGTLRSTWSAAPAVAFCTSKINSLGCTPAIAFTGTPKFSQGSGFVVRASNVINNKNGLLFYGLNGGTNAAFQGGTLCVQTPIRRTPAVNSGGNVGPNDCSGIFALDMSAFAAGVFPGTPPLPGLREPGQVVTCQWWGRDPGYVTPNNTTLSNGLSYVVTP